MAADLTRTEGLIVAGVTQGGARSATVLVVVMLQRNPKATLQHPVQQRRSVSGTCQEIPVILSNNPGD